MNRAELLALYPPDRRAAAAAELDAQLAAERAAIRHAPAAIPQARPVADDPTPLALTIPWGALVSDNRKYGVLAGRLILTHEYRDGKRAMHTLATRASRGRVLRGRVALRGVLHEPDGDRVRDPSNYAKCLHDALIGAVLDDDGQLDDVHYLRGPVDAAEPRMVLTLTPLGA